MICFSYFSQFPLLDIRGVGIEGAKYLHGLIVAGLGRQNLLKTLCSILHIPSGNVHLSQAKVRQYVAAGHKPSGL